MVSGIYHQDNFVTSFELLLEKINVQIIDFFSFLFLSFFFFQNMFLIIYKFWLMNKWVKKLEMTTRITHSTSLFGFFSCPDTSIVLCSIVEDIQ